jgi:hypothetical protein
MGYLATSFSYQCYIGSSETSANVAGACKSAHGPSFCVAVRVPNGAASHLILTPGCVPSSPERARSVPWPARVQHDRIVAAQVTRVALYLKWKIDGGMALTGGEHDAVGRRP